MVAFVLVFVVVTAAACHETPRDGFEAFYAALADGSQQDAYARLSNAAQAQFAGVARAKGLEPSAYLASAFPKVTVRRIDVVDEHGDRAAVDVVDALGNHERVQMVREDGRWRVDVMQGPQ